MESKTISARDNALQMKRERKIISSAGKSISDRTKVSILFIE